MKRLRRRADCICLLTLVIATTSQTSAAEEGLIGHWVFDQSHIHDKGLPDMAGKSLTTIDGPVRISLIGTFQALELDDKVSIQVNKNAEPKLPTRSMSVEAWVRIDKPHPWGGIVGFMQDNGVFERGWILGYNGKKFYFAVKTKEAQALNYMAAANLFQVRHWYHVVGTYDGAEQRLYVDGQLAASSRTQSGDIDYPSQAHYQIGAYRDQDEFYPTFGAIHEVRVYNRALTPQEVKEHFESKVKQRPDAEQLGMASIFGSHMVLQRDREVPLWGSAKKRESLTIRLGTTVITTTADERGAWQATLPPQKAGGPYKLSVIGKNAQVTLDDVLIGEVWICSGQSNMQWPVQAAAHAATEIQGADYPAIRLYTVGNVVDPEPQTDCYGKWEICQPNTVGGFSAVGFYFGRQLHKELKVPIGLVNASWGGSLCEAWMSRKALESDPEFSHILERSRTNPWLGRGLFNGMINPIIPFAMRGVIWYQGEANAPQADLYRKLFPALIGDWRRRWDQEDFPFYYVQLCPFKTDPIPWAELWDAQRRTLSVPNTGMVVTTDIGELRNIHPRNKQEVGRRLALWALSETYGRKGTLFSGPLYKSMKIEGSRIRIYFDHARGLASRDAQPLNWFSVAGQDHHFEPARATIDGETLLVQSEHVPFPVSVRFAWSGVAQPNLINDSGLPASPFRTDDWPLVTADKK